MGDRSIIVVKSQEFNTPISFYSHWSGADNLTAVEQVIANTNRLGDAGYVAAQIFHKFTTLGEYDGNLGFGIYPFEISGGDNPTVWVDADTGEITIEEDWDED